MGAQNKYGGERGIRTPGTPFEAYNRLAGDRFQPLSHLSASESDFIWRREQDSNPRTFRLTVFKTAAFDLSAIPPILYQLLILLIPNYPVNPIHIRSQHFRDNHTSVLLLVVFQYRYHCPSYGKT